MDEPRTAQALCGKEALDLLNCVTITPFDRDKCSRLLDSLRDCVLKNKVKKFLLPEQSQPKPEADQSREENPIS